MVFVSAVQQVNQLIHTHPPFFRLPLGHQKSMEESPLRRTVVLIAVYMRQPQSPNSHAVFLKRPHSYKSRES